MVLFQLAGMEPAQALSISLLARVMSCFLWLPGASILLWESFRLRRVQDPAGR
jgi:hypothetical protein